MLLPFFECTTNPVTADWEPSLLTYLSNIKPLSDQLLCDYAFLFCWKMRRSLDRKGVLCTFISLSPDQIPGELSLLSQHLFPHSNSGPPTLDMLLFKDDHKAPGWKAALQCLPSNCTRGYSWVWLGGVRRLALDGRSCKHVIQLIVC